LQVARRAPITHPWPVDSRLGDCLTCGVAPTLLSCRGLLDSNCTPTGVCYIVGRTISFRVWAVKTIDEGIEVLTGVRAGNSGDDNAFEDGTIHGLANAWLTQMAETLRPCAGLPDSLPSGAARG